VRNVRLWSAGSENRKGKPPMDSLSPSRATPLDAHQARPGGQCLRGGWLILVRTLWVTAALLHLVLFGLTVPVYFTSLETVCVTSACPPWQLAVENVRVLESWGFSVDAYATFMMALQVLWTAGFWTVAGLLFWRKSKDRLALFRRAGVGLSSMRERAMELGGACVVEAVPTGGTRVLARLPFPKERGSVDPCIPYGQPLLRKAKRPVFSTKLKQA
jgi:hypothetical protein